MLFFFSLLFLLSPFLKKKKIKIILNNYKKKKNLIFFSFKSALYFNSISLFLFRFIPYFCLFLIITIIIHREFYQHICDRTMSHLELPLKGDSSKTYEILIIKKKINKINTPPFDKKNFFNPDCIHHKEVISYPFLYFSYKYYKQ